MQILKKVTMADTNIKKTKMTDANTKKAMMADANMRKATMADAIIRKGNNSRCKYQKENNGKCNHKKTQGQQMQILKKATMANANITGYIIYVQFRYFRITVEFSWQRDNGKISTISLGQSK